MNEQICCRCTERGVELVECPRCGESMCSQCFGLYPTGHCNRCVEEIENPPRTEEISHQWCEPMSMHDLVKMGFEYRTFQTKHGRYYQAIRGDYYITVKQNGRQYRYQVAFVNDGRLRYITCQGFLSALEVFTALEGCAIPEARAIGWSK